MDVYDQKSKHSASILFEGPLTALRKDDGFDLMLRQTHSVDAHVPVGSQRSTDPEEQEDADGGEESDAAYEGVHPSNHILGVHDTEKK